MEAIETFENAGFTVSLYHDEHNAGSPREWDNLGKMVCWHRRYTLGDEQIKPSNFENRDALEASLGARIVIPLYLYDHGGITMRTSPFGDPWDSGQVGFIYVTDAVIREEYVVTEITEAVLERARAVLEGEVKDYDQYLTGDVYGWVVERPCKECGKGQRVDSCWGLYGLEYARKEAQAALASASNGKKEGG